MERKLNLQEQIAHFDTHGVAVSRDVNAQFHNFFDWFCKETSLKNKSVNLMRAVKAFVKANPGLNQTKHYVFFKNNCPMAGPLYDSFSICNSETGEVVYWVTPKSGHTHEAEIFSRATGFNTPLSTGKTLAEALQKAQF